MKFFIMILLIFLCFSCNEDKEIIYKQQDNRPCKGKIMCLYGDSTLDPQYLYDNLQDSLGFSKIFNRCVPGSGYYNGSVNSVYFFVSKADTSVFIRYGDPINNPTIDSSNLPEGCKEIDAHFYSNERINSIPTRCDLILIGGGVNDVARISNVDDDFSVYNIPQNYDYSRFKDCVLATICKIKERCPNAKILLLGLSPSRSVLMGGVYGERADAIDYCICQSAKFLIIPFFSLRDNLGWNCENILDYTDGVHPNTERGRKEYFSALCDFILSNIP